MQLPRRVPWATLAELDQLCSWVYGEDAHDASRNLAIERLSAWRFMTPLPHALESLLSILVAVRQDDTSGARVPSSLSLRQSYATALIRLVNGLVDPLQAGTYARSIFSIATQIGLPAWLVELRHAATHEDLPSLELLRDGAKESLSWLLHNYFFPALNPGLPHAHASGTAQRPPPPISRPVEPLLRNYKSLLKTVSRDASLRARYAADISGVLREIERWLSEARIAATTAAAAHTRAIDSDDFTSWVLPPHHRGRQHAGDDDGNHEGYADEEPEPREAWALDKLCDALLVKGGLVPISRKKRVSQNGRGSHRHHPPTSQLEIWVPLLESVAANHAHFPAVLTSRTITHLLAGDDSNYDHGDLNQCDLNDGDDAMMAVAAPIAERTSYDICLAAWTAWLIEWRRRTDESEADVAARKQEVVFQLVQALTPARQRELLSSSSSSLRFRQGLNRLFTYSDFSLRIANRARALLTALCESDRRLAGISTTVLGAMHVATEAAPAWSDADLDVMETRVKAVLSLSISTSDIQSPSQDIFAEEQVSASEKRNLPNGWRLLSELGGWRPCPIGVFLGGE